MWCISLPSYPVAVLASAPPPLSLRQFEGQLFSAAQNFSPFNVVAWHGKQGTRLEWPGMMVIRQAEEVEPR